MNAETQAWISKANDDIQVAELILPSHFYDAVCFHSQQAGEKYLKAVIEEKGDIAPKTHSLLYLLDILKKHNVDFPKEVEYAALELSAFGVTVRYPGVSAEPDEAKSAIESAKTIREWVWSVLNF